MSSSDSSAGQPTSPSESLVERAPSLLRYEAWLRFLARNEIDSRFAGKFDPSDAVQQTLLEAWRGWDNFRGNSEPQRLAWLRQILAHQLAHLARHYAGTHMRDVAREVSIEQSLSQSAQRLDAMLPAGDPSPSQHAVANEQRLILSQVIEELPEDYRQVILLRNIEDLPHEEVARRMNRSVGAVRMLWSEKKSHALFGGDTRFMGNPRGVGKMRRLVRCWWCARAGRGPRRPHFMGIRWL